jgi:hypothetical protein
MKRQQINKKLITPSTTPSLLHWNFKPSSSTKTEKVDSAAVLVTTEDHDVLLGNPKVPSSTGTAHAEPI